MPTGNLPPKAKALWEDVYEKSKDKECDEECAARKAWAAVKSAGWKKEGDKWVKHKAAFQEFSFAIKKASLDPETGEKRWRADTSDTEIDSYGDKMSLDLYEDFIGRIESKEPVPEEYRSDFWNGGLPYLSISHFPDLNGKGVPGIVDALFIDGKFLKSKGTFNDTPLGEKCWEAIKSDFQDSREDRVRISIGFLDYKHRHLGNDYVFIRESLDDICPVCLLELLTGEYEGKEFLEGHLVHLALTRVPVNKRTLMEVDKSMTTRKQDAESIVGEELAEELEEEAQKFSAKALVTKSEDGEISEIEIPGLQEVHGLLLEIKSLLTQVEETPEDVEIDESETIEDSEVPENISISELAVALSEGLSTGFGALGQKLDILISANSQKPNVEIPVRRGILHDPEEIQEMVEPVEKSSGEPHTIAEAIRRNYLRSRGHR